MHCHPSNAVRTKCACGRVISLGRSKGNDPPVVTCTCGREHRKAPGGWRGPDRGGERPGGACGCPGLKAAT
jgi:hypothetical protein